ncbi:LacI family DNA-binding transcriptional regulator [Streptomyces sp. B6B3]|uniref:LacI family DNA-binding transcriptional regulator n=1 Tax=Streptomyces sp. B6B3 TaxID=3153570 RepID=UPI00325CEEFB
MTTIQDVARRAGVSAATVSRVANGKATVDPELAERVRRAMRELDYRPNPAARRLRRSRSNLWAVIVTDVGNPFFTAVVRGVEDVARHAGFSVVLGNSDEDPAKEGRYVSAMLAEQVAGVVIAPCAGSPHVARLTAGGTPVVAIDREPPAADRDPAARADGGRAPAVDTVLVDNEGGAEAAVRHLLDAGYRRIACVTGPPGTPTADRRLAGYRRALAAHGAADTADVERLVRRADFRERGGHQAMASLLAERPAPDAVFATNNLMTVGALGCLAERGVAVPDRMGVVGFDEIPWADFVQRAPTTVAQPTHELGRVAAELLADRIENPHRPPSTVTLDTELRVRASSRGPAALNQS